MLFSTTPKSVDFLQVRCHSVNLRGAPAIRDQGFACCGLSWKKKSSLQNIILCACLHRCGAWEIEVESLEDGMPLQAVLGQVCLV